ncbi:MAG: TIGR04100 family radical SAM protein [Oscillospiraceae bacterium]|nr:TIGR04100 family radical SAM protein [Oscillospiraceae bacterium]MBQ4310207.1 TIGR04100 family radical SAM protein [Oscillospiraceae bacterium]
MLRSLTFVYKVHGNLYINLTNKCPCACTFCIRNNGDGAYGSDSLWLEREPTAAEVLEAVAGYEEDSYDEIVFCGYGEPTEKLEVLLEVAREVKSRYKKTVRLNTNGLGSRINGKDIAPLLGDAVDIVSVSLNAGSSEEYNRLCRPEWDDSYDEMLRFASECKKYVPEVMFSVVDVIPADEIERCRGIADRLGIYLRVRKYDS